jgi:arylsulfatase A-like enzyme
MAEFFAQRPKDKPYFLWVNFSDPHHPWNSGKNPPDPKKLKLPGYLPDLPGVREDLSGYLGEIEHMDGDFQGVLDLLKAKAGLENTVIKPGGDSSVLISGEDIAPTCLEAAGLKVPSRISGVSFLPLLQGKAFKGREHIFAERGPHGSASFTENTTASAVDYSRAVRSDRYKLIYNVTPNLRYTPVDSQGDPGWKEMVQANEQNQLASEFVKLYFTSPRPVYELYDLEQDPAELKNLAGSKELTEVEEGLKTALQRKMILDFDYLPLPIAPDAKGKAKA